LCVTSFSQKKQDSKQDTGYSSHLTSFSYGSSPSLPMPHRVMGGKPKDVDKWLRPRRNTQAHGVILVKGVCFLSDTREIWGTF
jgi:hypothetical protein